MISQEYFDEICLENAELFDDATEEQAVEATLEQIAMTTTTHPSSSSSSSNNNNNSNSSNSNNIRHLLTSFPTSPRGIQQRARVTEFLQALQDIQKIVAMNDDVKKDNDDDDNNNTCATVDPVDVVDLIGMKGILDVIHERLFSSSSSSSSSTKVADHENDNTADDAVVDSTVYMALYGSSMHDGFGLYLKLWYYYCFNSTPPPTTTTRTTTTTDTQNNDVYRLLWSTLVRVLVDNDNNNNNNGQTREDYQHRRRQVLSLYQMAFSGKITSVMSVWLQTVGEKLHQLQHQEDDKNVVLLVIMQDLHDLFTLAYYSVKQCEAKKKAFMGISFSTLTATTTSEAAAADDASTRRVNLVRVVLESLDWILAKLQQDNKAMEHSLCCMLWTREIGRLIAALDTFDDFSPASTTNGSNSSSAGVVSSGHDHVQAWKNARAVDKLHALLVEILQQQQQQRQQEVIDCDDEHHHDKHDKMTTRTTTAAAAADAAAAAAAAIVLALRSMAIQDDVVQAMVSIGILDTATQILLTSISSSNKMIPSSLELLSAVMGLVRNLCANDEIKTNLCLGNASGSATTTKSSIVPGIIHAMQQYSLQQLKKDNATLTTTTLVAAAATLQEHAIGTFAAMALRKPFNSDFIVRKCHAHVDILQAMRDYPQKTTLQRQGALCIRNLASRAWTMSSSNNNNNQGDDNDDDNQDLRTILLQADAATVLRETAAKHLHCQDEVYAALRDLGVPNIHFTVVHLDANAAAAAAAAACAQSTSSSSHRNGGMTTFGQGHNRNFRPVQDESR